MSEPHRVPRLAASLDFSGGKVVTAWLVGGQTSMNAAHAGARGQCDALRQRRLDGCFIEPNMRDVNISLAGASVFKHD